MAVSRGARSADGSDDRKGALGAPPSWRTATPARVSTTSWAEHAVCFVPHIVADRSPPTQVQGASRTTSRSRSCRTEGTSSCRGRRIITVPKTIFLPSVGRRRRPWCPPSSRPAMASADGLDGLGEPPAATRHGSLPGQTSDRVNLDSAPPPWRRELLPTVREFSANRGDRLYEPTELGLFSLHGDADVSGTRYYGTVDAYVEALHARNGFSRDRMDPIQPPLFDAAVVPTASSRWRSPLGGPGGALVPQRDPPSASCGDRASRASVEERTRCGLCWLSDQTGSKAACWDPSTMKRATEPRVGRFVPPPPARHLIPTRALACKG